MRIGPQTKGALYAIAVALGLTATGIVAGLLIRLLDLSIAVALPALIVVVFVVILVACLIADNRNGGEE